MTHGRCAAAIVIAASAALAAACAHSGAFQRSVGAGRWQEAAAAFRTDSALQRDPEALRIAARIHAVPDSATWDPDLALVLLARSRSLTRSGQLPDADLRLEAVLAYVVRERAARGAEAIVLRDSLDRISAQAEQLRKELTQLRETNAAYESERAVLQRMVSRLESDLHDRETQMAAVRSELDRLKEIDLARASHPPR
jgi:DNA repair exonuclease SbcCD ATPase subunit